MTQRENARLPFIPAISIAALWLAGLWTSQGYRLPGALGANLGQFLSRPFDVVYVAASLLILLALPGRNSDSFRVRALRLALALALNFALVESIKRLYWLPRPGGAHIVGQHAGFPSGHTVPAFGLAWLVSRSQPRLAPLWFGAATLIAWSRVDVHAHYTYQVVLSAFLGCGIGWLADRALSPKSTPESRRTL